MEDSLFSGEGGRGLKMIVTVNCLTLYTRAAFPKVSVKTLRNIELGLCKKNVKSQKVICFIILHWLVPRNSSKGG